MSSVKTGRNLIVGLLIVAGLWVSGVFEGGGDTSNDDPTEDTGSYIINIAWTNVHYGVRFKKIVSKVESKTLPLATTTNTFYEESLIYRRGTGGIIVSATIHAPDRIEDGPEVICTIARVQGGKSRIVSKGSGTLGTPASCSYDTGPRAWFGS